MRILFVMLMLSIVASGTVQGQLLKKIKDKANSVVNKSGSSESDEVKKKEPSDGLEQRGDKEDDLAPLDPDKYTLIYKPEEPGSRVSFLFDESCLGINANGEGYMVVIYDSKNKAEPYAIIENGKITARFKNASAIPEKCAGRTGAAVGSGSSEFDMKKETEKNYEKYVKSETKGGMPSHTVNINGKTYGPFMTINQFYVSPDGKQYFIDAVQSDASQLLYMNDKKVSAGEPGMYLMGQLVFGPDRKTMVFIGLSTMQMANIGKEDFVGTVIYTDGTKKDMKLPGADMFGGTTFKVTSKQELCWIDPLSGQFYADGKPVGKFTDNGKKLTLNNNRYKLLTGNDATKSVLLTDNGKVHFLDGSTQELSLYPFITVNNGITTLKWFKTRGSEIYLGHYTVK